MNRTDIFKIGRRSDFYIKSLKKGTFSKFPKDNEIVLKFVEAKYRGNYRNIIYDCNCPEKTVYKNAIILKKIITLLDKSLVDLTEEDIIILQEKLNQNKVLADFTNKPISSEYKKDMVKVLKQFWTFYRMYAKHEEKKDVENITEFFRIRKDKNTNPLIKFLSKEDIRVLSEHAYNLKMRTLIKVFFETGARTIEILNVRKFNCSFDTQKGKWLIKLPNMKGMSTGKMPIEIDFAHTDFSNWMEKNSFADDDYIFNYSYDYFRLYLARLGKKSLGRHVTPKMFRKSCAMHLVNLDINEQYIKGHMGWSANSKAISHYINQQAIKRPDKLNETTVVPQTVDVESLQRRLQQMEVLLMQKFADEF